MRSSISKVTTKGRLVIPSRVRRRYGIRNGTRVAWTEDQGRILLQPLTKEYIRRLRGSLKGKRSALKFLIESRRSE